MAKYYYESGGELHEIELAHGTVTKFKESNPHLQVKSATQISAEDRELIRKRLTNGEMRQKRKAEYPPIGDQLDAIMKWAFTETEITVPAELKSLAGRCMSVKAKYPLED